MPELERLLAFEEFVRKLDKVNYVQRKVERARRERKRRDAFRGMVKQLTESREVTY